MLIQNRRFVLGLITGLILFNIIAWIIVHDLSRPHFFKIYFFDVGQGDAIFIETPRRQQILIDGGPGSTLLEKLSQNLSFWDRTIDLIILTHPEYDHLSGLNEVLKRYQVENILWTGVVRDTVEFKEWERLIEKEKIKEGAQIKIAQAGQKIKWQRTVLCHFDILYPLEILEGKLIKNSNNTSIISKLVCGVNSFLFTGDAYKSVEEELLDRKLNIDSDVIKVGHHGSKTSTYEKFLEEVSPEIAVISVGKANPYHHPHQEILEILSKYDIRILRTDFDGDIKIVSDGKNFKIIE